MSDVEYDDCGLTMMMMMMSSFIVCDSINYNDQFAEGRGNREKVIIIKAKKKREKTHGAVLFREQVAFGMSAECCQGICFS